MLVVAEGRFDMDLGEHRQLDLEKSSDVSQHGAGGVDKHRRGNLLAAVESDSTDRSADHLHSTHRRSHDFQTVG